MIKKFNSPNTFNSIFARDAIIDKRYRQPTLPSIVYRRNEKDVRLDRSTQTKRNWARGSRSSSSKSYQDVAIQTGLTSEKMSQTSVSVTNQDQKRVSSLPKIRTNLFSGYSTANQSYGEFSLWLMNRNKQNSSKLSYSRS